MSMAARSGGWIAALLLGCSAPPVQSGINPVDGCATDQDCPRGYHCAGGGCQLFPRPCLVDPQCDPGQSCQKGNCLPANHGFCEPCATTADCASGGLCLSFPDGGDYCSEPCGKACSAAQGQCVVATDAQGNDAGETCVPESGVCANTPGGLDGGVVGG